MPEGPEIKYISELCKKELIGYKLFNIISNSKSVVKLPKESKVIDVMSKGKLLVLICKDFYFHIHFGLTGWLVFNDPKYPKYELQFKKDNKIITAYIDDMRRFSKLAIYDETKHNKAINKLGVDILTTDFTLDYFTEIIKSVKKQLVAFLLEQNKMCGIGNYIKNESLYISKISPYSKTDELDDDDIEKLYNAILFCVYSNTLDLIKEGELKLDNNFTKLMKSIKTEVPYKYRVYEQDKDPLGNKVIHKIIAGRKSYYVKDIQK
jgi:formamidopyrimidine-DNA glycosylase